MTELIYTCSNLPKLSLDKEIYVNSSSKIVGSIYQMINNIFGITDVIDFGAECGTATYNLRKYLNDTNCNINGIGIDLHNWTDCDDNEIVSHCFNGALCPTEVYHQYIIGNVVREWDDICNIMILKGESNLTRIIIALDMPEHLTEEDFVRLIRILKNNKIAKWIVLACPMTKDSEEPSWISNKFEGQKHRCAPSLELMLSLNPLAESIYVVPGGQGIGIFNIDDLVVPSTFIKSTAKYHGRHARSFIYHAHKETTGSDYSCAGVMYEWNNSLINIRELLKIEV